MSKVKFCYLHEDGTLVEFSPKELTAGVAHVMSYVYDSNESMVIAFTEITPSNPDPDAVGLTTVDLVQDSPYVKHLADDRQFNSVTIDDIDELKVEGMELPLSIVSYVKELIEEDAEAEAMDVDGLDEIDMEDEDYDDLEEEDIEDDDGESGDYEEEY